MKNMDERNSFSKYVSNQIYLKGKWSEKNL